MVLFLWFYIGENTNVTCKSDKNIFYVYAAGMGAEGIYYRIPGI